MRRTGKTSRIVDFAVDQLLGCGEVVISDHIDYPHDTSTNNNLVTLIQRRMYEHGADVEVDVIDMDRDVIQNRGKLNRIKINHIKITKWRRT